MTLDHIGLGCANIAGLYAPVSPQLAREALDAAWARGIRCYDTAPFYGRGLSERRVGDFLRDKPKSEYTLSTKVGRRLVAEGGTAAVSGEAAEPMPFRVVFDYSYDGIMRSVEDSHQRLGLTEVDILYVHDIGAFAHGEAAPAHFRTLMDSGFKALEELKSSSTISAFGLGVNENEVCVDVLKRAPIDQILLAGRYTLLDRTAERELLPLCVESGTRVVVGGIFNSGILATGPEGEAWFNYAPANEDIRARVRSIQAACERHAITLAQAALNFPLAHPAVESLLIGTHKPKTITRNLDALGAPLPQALLDEIAPFVVS
jgi:D-threo-aldose 1-dehydrogenase